jgi:hypothetical protein
MVAAGCEIAEEKVYKGMVQLWTSRWREGTGYVNLLFLECVFGMPGRGERCAEVLKAFGFLEDRSAGLWVCGAETYLRIKDGRSKGGKKAAANGNLKRGKRKPSSLSWESAGEQLENSPSSTPALTPTHPSTHTPNTETKTLVGLSSDPGPEERVFEHWKRVMGKNSNTVFDSNRRTKVRARLADGYSPEALCVAVDGCAKTPHNMGQNDRGEKYDDLALICRDASHVDRFTQNATAPPKRAAGGRFVNAQDVDQTSFATPGIVHDF